MNKLLTSIIFMLLLVAGSTVASDVFTLSVATEDLTQGSPTEAYYIDSTIRVWSYYADGSAINWGPVTRNSNPSNPQDAGAFRDFVDIPTDSIVRYENVASGYITDFDEIFITSELSDDFENNVANFVYSDLGFTTTCTLEYDINSFKYYDCLVEDNYGTSAGFFYYRPYDPVADEIYDLVYVTNKLMPTSACTDNDGDTYYVEGGYCGPADCNDNDATINPGATEICDGIDNNCANGADEGNVCSSLDYYCDTDSDGYISSIISGTCNSYNCAPAGCQLTPGTDCDDTTDITYPGATEICDNADNNCNTLIDENNVCMEEVIFTSWTPQFPDANDDLICTITVDNKYDPTNTDVIVDYDISGPWTANGQFTCSGGYCTQQLNISHLHTLEGTDMSCSAEFTYNGNTYSSTSTVHIYEGVNPNPQPSTDYNVEKKMRFLEDTTTPGKELEFFLGLSNKGDALSQAKAHIILLGVTNNEHRRYTVGPFDLEKSDRMSQTLHISIPEDTPRGMYYARVTLGDGDYRVVKHRVFFVE
jgi:hypothetical protein